MGRAAREAEGACGTSPRARTCALNPESVQLLRTVQYWLGQLCQSLCACTRHVWLGGPKLSRQNENRQNQKSRPGPTSYSKPTVCLTADPRSIVALVSNHLSTIMQLYCTTSNITQQEIQYRWKSRSLEHTQDTVPTPHRAQLAARTPFHIRSRAASIYISTARSPRVHGCFNSRRICTCHGTCIQFTSITPLAPTFEWIVFVQKGPSDDSSVMVIARPSTTRVFPVGRDFWSMLKL